jgi:hypothetical protein
MSSLACTPLGVDELSFWWWKGTGSSLRSWKANTLWISIWRAMSWRVMEPLKSLNSLWRSSWHFSMYCWNSWPQIYPCNMRIVSLNFHLHQISGVFVPWPTCLPYAPRTLTIDTWGTWQSLPFVYGEAGHLVIHRKVPQNFHTRAFLEQSSAEPLCNSVGIETGPTYKFSYIHMHRTSCWGPVSIWSQWLDITTL